MNKYVSRGLWTVLVTGGFMALGVGVAHADSGTSGEDGVASGTQGILGIELPVQLGGNAISILGDADSSSATTAAPAGGGTESTGSTSGTDSLAGGTQLLTDLGVPVTLGGNAISILGDASSSDAGTASVGSGSASAASGGTGGSDGTLSGTQVLGDLGVPVTLGGNAISVLGDASSDGAGTASGSGSSTGGQEGSTSGTDGILGGSQLLADLGLPVTFGGNAISVLGDASSSGAGTTAGAGTTGGGDATTGGTDGTLSGTQVLGDVGVPVTLGGNAISVLGDASSTGSGATAGSGSSDGGATTGGTDGILGGSQILADLGVPVTLGGNAISVLGDASTGGSSTDVDPGTDPGEDPGTDPGTDPGDDPDGGDLATYALADDGSASLAATGADGGLTALALAGLLLAVGGLMTRRVALRRR